MKLQIDLDKKTIAYEGQVKVADLFNRLMAWFPEDWEQWSFVQYIQAWGGSTITYPNKLHNNPYFNPFSGAGTIINIPYYGTASTTLINSALTVSGAESSLTNAITTNQYTIKLED